MGQRDTNRDGRSRIGRWIGGQKRRNRRRRRSKGWEERVRSKVIGWRERRQKRMKRRRRKKGDDGGVGGEGGERGDGGRFYETVWKACCQIAPLSQCHWTRPGQFSSSSHWSPTYYWHPPSLGAVSLS